MKKKIAFLALLLSLPFIFGMGPKVDKHRAVWDANSESDLAGYYLYWRTPSGAFSDTNRVQIPGTPTSPEFDLSTLNLSVGTYFIAVTAYDMADNESGPSNEAPFDNTVPANPSGTAVVR